MQKQKLSRKDVAQILEGFLDGTGHEWAWDDFTTFPLEDPELERIRIRCATLDSEFPPAEKGHFCGAGGLAVIRGYIRDLRADESLH